MTAKATVKDLELVKKDINQRCTLDDLKKLYKKVTPTLKLSEQQMEKFGGEIEKFREIIKQNDEMLLTKANKQTVYDLEV